MMTSWLYYFFWASISCAPALFGQNQKPTLGFKFSKKKQLAIGAIFLGASVYALYRLYYADKKENGNNLGQKNNSLEFIDVNDVIKKKQKEKERAKTANINQLSLFRRLWQRLASIISN